MSILKPFPGIRPSKALAEKVAAPPYDVLNSAEARVLAEGNAFSFLHINKPEIDLAADVDVHDDRVYEKGAENLQRFLKEEIISQDDTENYYVYRQIMGEHQQTGLVAVASVAEYENDLIKKHEFTRPEKEDDRVKHMDHLNTQVGPVFLTYQAEATINKLISQCTAAVPEYDFTGEDGIRHVFWVVNNADMIASIESAFQKVPCLYVADGHHRSAAAMRIKQMCEKKNPSHSGNEAYNFFLVVVFPHDQMQILDYNRVVLDLNGLRPEGFLEKLADKFVVTKSAVACKPKACHEFGMYLDGQWYSLTTRADVVDENDPVARLDVAILQDNILSPLLAIGNPRTDQRIDFVGGIRGMQELEKRVDSGECAVAFACYPTSIENLMAIADAGEVMPPKSTWFEPKLKTGLVIHGLD
ncbi:DUF1015 family protein [Gammaproteobacteria bacterium]|nr:DUF1015 family protein [Gammaproteobacteria bacterium]